MSLNDEQKRALAADLNRAHVRQRSQSGRSLSYIEGWHAIAEANRIFGFDGWTRETVECRCIAEGPRPIGQAKVPGFGVSYVAKCRVTIAGVVREGYGTGHGVDRDLGLAHESALKEAETDAMKRALMTFGNPFGLALYDKTQANVSDGDDGPNPDYVPSRSAPAEVAEFPGDAARRVSSHALRNGQPGRWDEVVKGMRACASYDALRAYAADIRDEVASWPESWREQLNEVYEVERDRLKAVA